jgi:WD40 repeat protein
LSDRVFISPRGGYLTTVQPTQVTIHRIGTSDPPVVLPVRDALHVGFSPDERYAVTASDDQTGRVWAIASGQPVSAPLEHRGPVRFAAFSPCGRFVVTAGQDKAARVWDVQTGTPLTPWLLHRGPVAHASFAPDGVRLITASHDGSARVWDVLAVENRPVAELALVAEVLSGHRSGTNSGSPATTPASYLAAWQQLNRTYPKEYAGR